MAIGLVTAFPLLSIMMLSMTNAENIVMSELPYAELFYQITESRPATILFMVWVTIVLFCKSRFRFLTLDALLKPNSCTNRSMGNLWTFGMGFC